MISRGIGMTSERTRRRLVEQLRAQGIGDERVLDAIASVPRHMFVDEALSSRAYENSALPIGRGQTISQPLVVAMMTEAVLASPRHAKVLEIGTGSGYQAAVLARLFSQVFSTERIGELARLARQRLHALKLHNVFTRHADGLEGWPTQAPFDAIMVTAGGRVPESLRDQLGDGGVLVAPVGQPDGSQQLVRWQRQGEEWQQQMLGAVSFVPLLPGMD
ncbi:MAG: protein-L-isoaspartate(D-aspartate) O-methyltransferase [Wenzhouxiangellaceae bacterium]|nr:protein-L-isoaspartate(D-aspartate) O-methyltransferase [Wenzhouxiangellaceae bacterium]